MTQDNNFYIKLSAKEQRKKYVRANNLTVNEE